MMTELPGRLGDLAARDVMTPEVVALNERMTLAEAADVLRQHHISGAPVVTTEGKLVGMLSLTDIVEKETEGLAPVHSGKLAWHMLDHAGGLEFDNHQLLVKDRMSRTVASIGERAPLVDAARIMCDGHWHRLPVLDHDGKLSGIISTMDILAALVNVADEAT
ncbi:CBS domain-containing protein [Calycomorphotria hydatis]|uniref:Inosine 5'-monophosphate dehydrogenase n=1 Tax=Calycomorphotria hydatis TaxID=2528027 RepID=A0A517T9C0_9PLAN|nr:CBS domain-containing protein [Calycomorphotria hydatis]QDT64963.1 inosine 5'-monophosphate dehydrogenase [Calycomorphotria hydatis]